MEDIAGIILLQTILGYPYSWKKFRGGDVVQWIGYEIDFRGFSVGISLARAQWLINWVQRILKEGKIDVEDLVAVLGRFCFAMGPLDFLRPFLAPLYAWCSAVGGVGRLNAPWSVLFLLDFLAKQLGGTGRVLEIQPVGVSLGEAFRADAKAEGNEVVIGGWECLGGRRPHEARWFSISLSRASAPWAFARGEPYRTIAALELYGTLVCILAFAEQWPKASSGTVVLAGSTDNQGNSWVLNRLMTSKFPMVVVLGELALQLRSRNLNLSLEWVPRLQNEEADALTNGDFASFNADNRVHIDPGKLDFIMLPDLLKVAEELYSEIVERRANKGGKPGRSGGRKVKLKERDPWG